MLAIRMRLVHDFAYGGGVVASIGLDQVRYLARLRAGQDCQVRITFLEARPFAKRADCGVAVLSMKTIVLMRRRIGQDAATTP